MVNYLIIQRSVLCYITDKTLETLVIGLLKHLKDKYTQSFL